MEKGHSMQWPKRSKEQEEFNYTKSVSEIRKSKDRQKMPERKRTNGEATIYKALHRKLKIVLHEPH